MKQDHNLEFLRYKIAQTGTALCSFHLPDFSNISYIIHTTSVDDNGNICFSMVDSLPANTHSSLDGFQLKLFFFKKGLGYHLNIEAFATATSYIEQSQDSSDISHAMLYVKAKIISAVYSEGRKDMPAKNGGIIYSVRKRLTQMAAGLFV
jgi:hypothetical protein